MSNKRWYNMNIIIKFREKYMKKFIFVSLFTVVTFVFTLSGCASSSNSKKSASAEEDVRYEWYITRSEGGSRAKYNQVKTIINECYFYIYFPARKVEFEKIKLDFTIDRPVEVIWQAVYQEGMVAGAEIPIGTIDKGPIETGFEKFNLYWYRFDPTEVLNTSKINGVCLKIKDPVGGSVFRLTDVSFIGLK
jgi:hypothetical protein